MDRPAVDRVDGVPPAIAIDQTNPVRTSRSTVGTMTELNDHLKLLFARAAQLFDKQTALPVRHDTPETIYADLLQRVAGRPAAGLHLPGGTAGQHQPEQIEQWLSASGFSRVQAEREAEGKKLLDVVADRFRLGGAEKVRVMEAIELALKRGSGRLNVYKLERRSASPSCGATPPACIARKAICAMPTRSRRCSRFNSAFGACETCRGFGRVIGVDLGLVIPDPRKTLRNGAIKTIMTPAWNEIHDDLLRYAGEAGIPRDTAWNQLTAAQRDWVLNGSPNWNGKWNKQWYGIHRFFGYLESKAYKMHIRVLLSKYRSYTPCTACGGARLKLEALLWRLGDKASADTALPPAQRNLPVGATWSRAQLEAMPGLSLHDLMLLPIDRLRRFFDGLPLHDAETHARRGAEAAARRDPHAAQVPVRCRPGLPDAGPAEPHAQRRRGAAHQPDHGARHLAGEHAVRARRAEHRPAPARHEPHRRSHAPAARCRQHAGGGGARPGGDARRRPA